MWRAVIRDGTARATADCAFIPNGRGADLDGAVAAGGQGDGVPGSSSPKLLASTGEAEAALVERQVVRSLLAAAYGPDYGPGQQPGISRPPGFSPGRVRPEPGRVAQVTPTASRP